MARVPRTGLSPAAARLSRRLPLPSLLPLRRPYNPARASTPAVWAGPLSLAATRGVTLVFLSSDYWDVSVRRVRLPQKGMPCLRTAGCPIRTPTDLGPFAPPRGLSRPAASFIASGSQGILRAPSLASRSSVSTRSLVSAFLPSCQRTAQGESLLRVGCAGTIPPRRGLKPHSPCPSRSVPASTGPVLDSPACPSRKEVFQPHLPVRLPCYDLAPVTPFALDGSSPASGARGSHGLTGGVYKARERIHRAMADARLLAIPASRGRVAAPDPY